MIYSEKMIYNISHLDSYLSNTSSCKVQNISTAQFMNWEIGHKVIGNSRRKMTKIELFGETFRRKKPKIFDRLRVPETSNTSKNTPKGRP